jgi:hypothetical protein
MEFNKSSVVEPPKSENISITLPVSIHLSSKKSVTLPPYPFTAVIYWRASYGTNGCLVAKRQ